MRKLWKGKTRGQQRRKAIEMFNVIETVAPYSCRGCSDVQKTLPLDAAHAQKKAQCPAELRTGNGNEQVKERSQPSMFHLLYWYRGRLQHQFLHDNIRVDNIRTRLLCVLVLLVLRMALARLHTHSLS